MDIEYKKSVLFLNSDMTISTYLKSFLEDNHYDVYTAMAVDDVMLSLTIKPISCILLDIFIKWANSMELLRLIRKQHIDIPIIVLGDGNIKNIVNFQKYCISDYIIKPINKLKLLDRIEKSIEEKDATYLRYFHVGELYTASKHYDIARFSFENAIKLNEDFIPAFVSLIEIYMDLDQLDTAKELLDKAFEKAPEDNKLHELKGDFLVKTKQYAKALSSYRRVVKADPARIGVFVKLAQTNVMMGDLKEALLSLFNVIKIKPDYREAIYESLSILDQEKNIEQMYAVSKKSLRYYPNDERVVYYYLMSLYESGLMPELGEYFSSDDHNSQVKILCAMLMRGSFTKLPALSPYLPKKTIIALFKTVTDQSPEISIPLLELFYPLMTPVDFFISADEIYFKKALESAQHKDYMQLFVKKHIADFPASLVNKLQIKIGL